MPLIAESKPVRIALARLANYRVLWEVAGLLMPRRGLDFFASRIDETTIEEAGKAAAMKLRRYVTRDSIVLDLGCGLGRVAKQLAPFCKKLYAADTSSAYCMRARNYLKNRPNISVVRVEGSSLQSFFDETVDFVYSWEVLVHTKRQLVHRYLQEVHRVLKPDGVFYFHLPKPEISFPPFEWYTQNDLKQLLESSPLELQSRFDGRDEITVVMEKISSSM